MLQNSTTPIIAGYPQRMAETSDSDALLAEEDRKKNSCGAMKSKPIPIKGKSICI